MSPSDAEVTELPSSPGARLRREREAQTLASLTGWRLDDVRARMALPAKPPQRWWESLW